MRSTSEVPTFTGDDYLIILAADTEPFFAGMREVEGGDPGGTRGEGSERDLEKQEQYNKLEVAAIRKRAKARVAR